MTWRFPWEGDDPTESRALRHIGQQLEQVLTNQETQMASTQELTDAVGVLSTDVAALVSAGQSGINPADLDPLLTQINDLDATVKAATPVAPTA